MNNEVHILILTTGLRGRLNSTLALASRLREANYEVTFASPWNCADHVRLYRFTYVQLPETSQDTTQYASQEKAMTALGVDDLSQVIEKLHPQLLLIDFELAGHILAAQSVNIPIALISSWFDVCRSKEIPPLSFPIVPGRGLQGSRVGIAWAWARFIARWRWHYKSKKIRWRGTDYRTVLQALAKKNNIELLHRTSSFDCFAVPFVWRDIPILSMNAAELDLPHKLPNNLTYVGPMVMSERIKTHQNHPALTEIDQLIEVATGDNRKLIYCSASTMSADLDLRTLVQQVADQLDNVYFIVSSPLITECTRQDRVLYLKYAPQLYLLQHADLAINHGGINTINECLHFGVPMVIISGGKFDQHGCAARIAFHDLGTVFFTPPSAAQLAYTIQTNLESRGVKIKIEAYQRSIQHYIDNKELERKIGKLISANG